MKELNEANKEELYERIREIENNEELPLFQGNPKPKSKFEAAIREYLQSFIGDFFDWYVDIAPNDEEYIPQLEDIYNFSAGTLERNYSFSYKQEEILAEKYINLFGKELLEKFIIKGVPNNRTRFFEEFYMKTGKVCWNRFKWDNYKEWMELFKETDIEWYNEYKSNLTT